MSAESVHVRPSRPRPSIWCSASATAPWAAPAGSIRCVVVASAAQWYSRPNEPRSRGSTTSGSSSIGTKVVAVLVYDRLSDPILVRRAKDGDETALVTLCERHAPRIERIALHVLRDPEDARDAAQESLVKLVQRIGQFRGQSQFSTWLHRLVVNTCKDVAQARWAAQRRTV